MRIGTGDPAEVGAFAFATLVMKNVMPGPWACTDAATTTVAAATAANNETPSFLVM